MTEITPEYYFALKSHSWSRHRAWSTYQNGRRKYWLLT